MPEPHSKKKDEHKLSEIYEKHSLSFRRKNGTVEEIPLVTLPRGYIPDKFVLSLYSGDEIIVKLIKKK